MATSNVHPIDPGTGTGRGPTPTPVLTTALACVLQGVGGGLGWSLLPPLMPSIAGELGLTHLLGGLAWGAAPLGIALAAPFGGAAADRIGPRKVAGLAMLVGALACGLRALVVGPWSLIAVMFLFGLHIGFVAPSVPKALAGHVPLAKLGRANGLALLSYTLATAATVLTARTVLAPAFGGWRPLMVAAAVAMGLAGIAWLVAIRDRITVLPHAGLGAVFAGARHPELRKVAAIHFLLFGGYLALLGFLPRALTEAGLEPAKVGIAVAVWLVAAGVANFVGPTLSDRIGRRRPFLVWGGVVAGLGLLGVALLPPATGVWLLVVAALGGGAFAPLLLTLPVEMDGIGPARAGAALGLLMLVGQVGGFLLPVVVGGVAGSAGAPLALGLLAFVHLLIVWPALRLAETGSAARPPVTPPAPGDMNGGSVPKRLVA